LCLVAFASLQQSNRGFSKRIEREDDNLQKTNNYSKFKMSPFRHIGQKGSSLFEEQTSAKNKRSPFKNLR